MTVVYYGGSPTYRKLYADAISSITGGRGLQNPNVVSATGRQNISSSNREIQKKAKEIADKKFAELISVIASELKPKVDQLGSSQNLSDRTMAEYYSQALEDLYDPKKRERVLEEYSFGRLGSVPGRQMAIPKMPPAWS